MSSKSPHNSKLAKKPKGETEWERLRNECAWSRINEMAKVLIEKTGDKAGENADAVVRFLYDESQLEIFVHTHGLPTDCSAEELQQMEVLEKRFRDALFLNELSAPSDCISTNAGSTLKSEVAVQLSKTLLLQRRFDEALEVLENARLRVVDATSASGVSLSYLRLLLDAHTVRALCIEQLALAAFHRSSSGPDSDADADVANRRLVPTFESCVESLVLYATEFDRRVSSNETRQGHTRETGAQTETTGNATAEQTVATTGGLSAALNAFVCNPLARLVLDRAAFSAARLGVDVFARLVGRLRDLLRVDLRAPNGGAAQVVRARVATALSRALLRHASDASYLHSSEPTTAFGAASTAPIGLTASETQTFGFASMHKVHTTPSLTPAVSQSLAPTAGGLQRLGTSRSRLGVGGETDQSFGPPPRTLADELLLLLCIAENWTRRNVVLSRARELSEPRRATLEHAIDVLDTLTVVCTRYAAYEPLTERLERATAYSFNEPHVWRAFALALVEAAQPYRAYLVLREWRRMQPRCALVCSLLARVCLEQLAPSSTHFVDEALECSRTAVRLQPTDSRAQLLVGVSCAMKARAERVREERDALHAEALRCFQAACTLDPHDALAAYHAGLSHAIARNLKDAAACSARAARLNPDCWYAVQLCVLVLSARREFDDAARLAAQLLEDWPSIVPLYVTKARLARLFNRKAAETLVSGLQRADALFHDAFDAACACGLAHTSDSRSVGSPNASLTPQIVFALQRGESPLAMVTEAPTPSQATAGSDRQSVRSDNYAPSALGTVSMRDSAAHIDADAERVFVEACRALCIYLRLAAELVDCYAQLDRVDAARAIVADCEMRCARCCVCVETSLNEVHNVRCTAALAYLRGLLLEHTRDSQAARDEYLSVVLCGEADVNCLQHLCSVLMDTGQLQLAEKYIRDAIAIEPQSSRSWEKLGQVLQSAGQHEAAIDCFTRAIELSQTEPIEPFSVLPLPVQ